MKRVILSILVLLLALSACREVPSDKLYALHLEQAPTVADWQRALPRLVTVRGGREHRVDKLADIDEDTVHTTTASCHHGTSLPDPVEVEMRAFYTDSHLYLRLAWADRTCDDAIHQWRFDGAEWASAEGLEDGFGLLWDAEGRFPRFTCSFACHLHDFGVAGSSFHATNKMKLARDAGWLDLWNWKADRTGSYGFADDRFLDKEGMHGDLPGELHRPNSRLAAETGETAAAFGKGDRPLVDVEGRPVGEAFLPPETTAPGYLLDRPVGGRSDISARGKWRDGRWIVVLSRRLDTDDPRDVVFVPGDESGVAFGLSLMDNTLSEHYASTVVERLVLLDKD